MIEKKTMHISKNKMLRNDKGFTVVEGAICLAVAGLLGALFWQSCKESFKEFLVKRKSDYPAVVAFQGCAERLLENGKGAAFKDFQGARVSLLPFGNISQVNVAERNWIGNKTGLIIVWTQGKVFKYEQGRYDLKDFQEMDSAPYREAIEGLAQCHSEFYLKNLPKPAGAGN